MSRVIVFTRADGGLSIMAPAVSTDDVDISEDDALKRAFEKDLPSGASNAFVVDAARVPEDDGFRNAWRFDAGKFGLDMPSAREIAKTQIRERRSPMLAQLDIDYMRADEAGDTEEKTRITTRKKYLRDATHHPDIAAAQNAEALRKAVNAAVGDY